MTTGNNAINTQLPFVVGSSGTYTTIQSAINAAALIATSTNKQVVLINPGEYTENLSLKSFVYLSDFDGTNGSVTIIGNAVYNALNDNESLSINGIDFKTPGGGGIAFSVSGTKIVSVDIHSCTITGSTGTAFSCTNSSATVIKDNCHLVAGAGQKICNVTGGTIKVIAGFAEATDTASTISGSTIFQILSCFDTNAFVLTGTVTFGIENSVVIAPGTLTFIDVGAGCTIFVVFSSILSNAASGFYITGSGNLIMGGTNPLTGSAINVDPAITFISSTTDIGTLRLLKQSIAIDMNANFIHNVLDPVLNQDVASKFYVDQTALNGTSVYAASTVNLTVTQAGAGVGATLTNAGVQAVFALDGVNPPLGSNVLIKNLAAAQNEGIYTVTNVGSGATNWVLTRATGFDTPIEINNTGLIVIQNGTQAGQAWYNTATIVTVDTTPFNFVRFGTTGTVTSITAGSGITLTPSPITSTGSVAVTAGQIPGTATNDNASAGNVGEFIESIVTQGSPVTLTSTVAANITSISLTAGDWDVYGNGAIFDNSATETLSRFNVGSSSTSATLPAAHFRASISPDPTAFRTSGQALPLPVQRYSLAGTTTVYLVVSTIFTGAGTVIGWGYISGRRVR